MQVPSGTTSTTVSPDVVIPAPTTTTTSTTIPEPGLVVTDIGESRVMQLDVQAGGITQLLTVEVIVPDASSGAGSTLDMGLSTRSKQSNLEDGFITVRIDVKDTEGIIVTALDAPIEIRMPHIPVGAVLGSSVDEITWRRIPQLVASELPNSAQDGFFIHPDQTVSIYTRHLTFFGYRKPQTSIAVSMTASALTAGSLTVATASGGESEDNLQYYSMGKIGSCTVNENGLIRGGSAGTCSILVSRGGGSVYMSSISRTHSVEVVRSITPISIPVNKRGLFIQFWMLCVAIFMTVRTARYLFNRVMIQRTFGKGDDK